MVDREAVVKEVDRTKVVDREVVQHDIEGCLLVRREVRNNTSDR